MRYAKYIVALVLAVSVFTVAPIKTFAAWTYEQLFNTLSNGDLNGQDSWSGGTAVDVQSTVVYEGAKAIIEVNGNTNMTRSITAVTSGTMYIAGRMEAGFGDGANFDMRSNGNTNSQIRIAFRDTGNISAFSSSGENIIVTGFLTGTWYLFEITFNGSSYTVRYNTSGTSAGWSSSFGPYNYQTGAADIDTIRFNLGGSQTSYWDTITPTNPIASAPAFNPWQHSDY